jgi:Na+/H+ antiporter NhaD/arsenite permease-like protein
MNTIALIIFIITYTGIIFTRLPRVNIDRPSAAFFGAVAMVLFGVVSFGEAVSAIDFNTIALLLGMMIIISTLELDGFFEWIAFKTLSIAHTPNKLLVVITLVTGLASAFLVNDAVVLLFTPVIIGISRKLGVHPVPYLIAEILASNIGSAMTITGNPQNMLIGINSGMAYGYFLLYLLPVSLTGLVLIIAVLRWLYRIELAKGFKPSQLQSEKPENEWADKFNFHSMRVSVPIFLLVIIAFFLSKPLGISIPLIALSGASLILIFGKVKPSKVIRQCDWVLLLFFASLFVVVHGIEKTGFIQALINSVNLDETSTGIAGLHLLSLVGSQLVSNVPFTVVMLPLLKSAGSDILWLSLASASTLAGNATIIGAMANLIVIESAESKGIKIGFVEFFKSGIIVTVFSLLISFGYLYLHLMYL